MTYEYLWPFTSSSSCNCTVRSTWKIAMFSDFVSKVPFVWLSQKFLSFTLRIPSSNALALCLLDPRQVSFLVSGMNMYEITWGWTPQQGDAVFRARTCKSRSLKITVFFQFSLKISYVPRPSHHQAYPTRPILSFALFCAALRQAWHGATLVPKVLQDIAVKPSVLFWNACHTISNTIQEKKRWPCCNLMKYMQPPDWEQHCVARQSWRVTDMSRRRNLLFPAAGLAALLPPALGWDGAADIIV